MPTVHLVSGPKHHEPDTRNYAECQRIHLHMVAQEESRLSSIEFISDTKAPDLRKRIRKRN